MMTIDAVQFVLNIRNANHKFHKLTIEQFHEFMHGQTCAYVENVGTLYYVHDVARFLNGLPIVD